MPAKRRRVGAAVLCAALAAGAPGCGLAARARPPTPQDRARGWAEPLDRAGLRNFHKVSPELYRGAQPTAAGMAQLERLGVRTVVSLRSFYTDHDKLADTRLAYEHIYMKLFRPQDAETVEFLQVVTDPRRTPVFVHCDRGADRAGAMCAVYRIVVQGWTKEDAIREMMEGPYGFFRGWRQLVSYIDGLDVGELRRRAGLSEASDSRLAMRQNPPSLGGQRASDGGVASTP